MTSSVALRIAPILFLLPVPSARGAATQDVPDIIESSVEVVFPTGSRRPLHSRDRTPGPPFYVKPSVEIPNHAAAKNGNGANTPNTNPGGGGTGGGNSGIGPAPLTFDPVIQPFNPTVGTEVPTQFPGADNSDNSQLLGIVLNPPDPIGDVGPNHYVQMINLVLTMYDKSGNVVRGPEPHTNMYTASHDCGNTTKSNGDPVVLYDEQADRWILSHFAFSRDVFGLPTGPYYQCVAASKTSDPTGEYWRYAFNMGGLGGLHDYPKLGVTPSAITMTAHMFSFNLILGGIYEGQFIGAINKSTLYAGAPTQIVGMNIGEFDEGFLPADYDDPYGVVNHPLLFATAMSNGGFFEVHRLNADFANPQNTTIDLISSIPIAPSDLDLCSATRERCVPHTGGGPDLETLGDRLMHRLQVRDFGSYMTMLAAWTVDADAAPAGTPGRAGIRWNEFRSFDGGNTWSLYQEATFAPPDGLHRWMPSIAMNGAGDIGIGYMISSDTMHVGMHVSGQTAANSGTGLFDAMEGVCQAGVVGSDWSGRSGDYTSTNVDFLSDKFWHTGQYANTGSAAGWGTAICEFDLDSGPGNQAPTVTITAPADGSSHPEGSSISFTGTANDNEDGDLSASLAWSSDIDGNLGTGASVSAVLSVGTHLVTASVTDSGSNTGTDTITISVDPGATAPMHVSLIVLGTQNAGRGFKNGTATVTILDGSSNPVSNATVSGTFSGDFNEAQSNLTDGSGVVSFITTGDPLKGPEFSFCVSNVTHGSFSYDPSDNADPSYQCGNTPPVVTITAPSDQSTHALGAPINFSGTALDTEDGDLTANLAWVSSLDGAIGAGGSFSTSTLTEGVHTVTASVQDSGSLPGSGQITITVGSVPTPSSLHVELITTGTVNAGQGFKHGTATVTIHDNLGNPVPDALIGGQFFGTFNDIVGTGPLTDVNGMATFTTAETAKGGVDVSFCVIFVTNPALLPYSSSDNTDPSYACVP